MEQKRGDTKILKGGWQAGSRGGCLRKWGGWNPLTNYERLFHTFLISIQKQIKKFLNEVVDCNFYVITFSMQHVFSLLSVDDINLGFLVS